MTDMVRQDRRSERGAALVEYALVLPVLLLLTLGSLEVFRLLSVQQSLRTGLKQALPFYNHWRDIEYYNSYCAPYCNAAKDPSAIILNQLRNNRFARNPVAVAVWPDALTLDRMPDGTVFELVVTAQVELGFLYPLPGGPTITLRESAFTFVDSYPAFYGLVDYVPFPRDTGALPFPTP